MPVFVFAAHDNPPDDATFAATMQPRNQRKIQRNQREIQQFTENWGKMRGDWQNSSEFPRDFLSIGRFSSDFAAALWRQELGNRVGL